MCPNEEPSPGQSEDPVIIIFCTLVSGHYVRVGGGRCKSEKRTHSKFAPLESTEISPPSKGLHRNFAPPLNLLALKFMPPYLHRPPTHK